MSTARSATFAEAADRPELARYPPSREPDNEDPANHGRAVARGVTRGADDGAGAKPQTQRASPDKRNFGTRGRSTAMERRLHDRSRPKRVRRADVDLRQQRRTRRIPRCVLTQRCPTPQQLRGTICAEIGFNQTPPAHFANPPADFEWRALFDMQLRGWSSLLPPRFPLRRLTLRNIRGACRGKAISIASIRHRSNASGPPQASAAVLSIRVCFSRSSRAIPTRARPAGPNSHL